MEKREPKAKWTSILSNDIMQIIILDVEYFKMTVVGCRLCQVASSRRKFVA